MYHIVNKILHKIYTGMVCSGISCIYLHKIHKSDIYWDRVFDRKVVLGSIMGGMIGMYIGDILESTNKRCSIPKEWRDMIY